MSDTTALPPTACLNCGENFGHARPKFCPACGQETNVKAPRVAEFLQQFGGAYFTTEGAAWRTLKLLITKPGELTAQYLAGRRKHYLLPLRLLLSLSVVMLLTLRIVSAIDFASMDDAEVMRNLPEKPRSVRLELLIGDAGLDDGEFYCHNLPEWMCRRVEKRLDVDTRSMVLQMQKASERVASHAGMVTFVLLPAHALLLSLLYRRSGLHYTEQLVFSMHLHAFWFLLAALMMAGGEWVALAGVVVVPIYGLLAMRRVYGGPWWALGTKALVITALHGLLVATMVAVVMLVALLA
jgi:hypothetical protein